MSLEEQALNLSQEEIVLLLSGNQSYQDSLSEKEIRISELEEQLSWFKRQLFGVKSERRFLGVDHRQLSLGEVLTPSETPPPPSETVNSYQRKNRKKPYEGSPDDTGLRFDPSLVPVEEIEVPNPDLEGLSEDDYDEISEKTTYRLAQRPGSYVILKYVRKTIKLKSTEELKTAPAPAAVIDKSYADVSFLVGLLIDKFLYHIPLYRQHQRLDRAGVKLSRGTLSSLVHRSAELLEPVYLALLSSILDSSVLAMDETPIKAGRKSKGKMQTGYFWPIYGDKDEIAFVFAASRAGKVAREALGEFCGVLISDGYKVYERLAETLDSVIHAQCWSHTRRKFVEAENSEPELAKTALRFIGQLYEHERIIQEKALQDEKKLLYRAENSKPVVEEFFVWLEEAFQKQILLPTSPFTKAANYALHRETQLKVFLQFPDVPIDTNHLERQIRPVAIGRKNYLFCWTELGARYAGIIYSLIASCRLHQVEPYAYLVDVLQRIDSHPVRDVHLLTPREWKRNFAHQTLTSDVTN